MNKTLRENKSIVRLSGIKLLWMTAIVVGLIVVGLIVGLTVIPIANHMIGIIREFWGF